MFLGVSHTHIKRERGPTYPKFLGPPYMHAQKYDTSVPVGRLCA